MEEFAKPVDSGYDLVLPVDGRLSAFKAFLKVQVDSGRFFVTDAATGHALGRGKAVGFGGVLLERPDGKIVGDSFSTPSEGWRVVDEAHYNEAWNRTQREEKLLAANAMEEKEKAEDRKWLLRYAEHRGPNLRVPRGNVLCGICSADDSRREGGKNCFALVAEAHEQEIEQLKREMPKEPVAELVRAIYKNLSQEEKKKFSMAASLRCRLCKLEHRCAVWGGELCESCCQRLDFCRGCNAKFDICFAPKAEVFSRFPSVAKNEVRLLLLIAQKFSVSRDVRLLLVRALCSLYEKRASPIARYEVKGKLGSIQAEVVGALVHFTFLSNSGEPVWVLESEAHPNVVSIFKNRIEWNAGTAKKRCVRVTERHPPPVPSFPDDYIATPHRHLTDTSQFYDLDGRHLCSAAFHMRTSGGESEKLVVKFELTKH